jgi:hypothetical protein
MNLIPYSYFIYLNYLLAAFLVTLPFIANLNTPAAITVSVLLGVLLFFVTASSKDVTIPKTEFISKKIVITFIFAFATLLPFLHFFLPNQSNQFIIWASYFVSGLQFIGLIFSNLKIEE